MKRKFTYPLFALAFVALLAFIIIRYQKKQEIFYGLQERKGALASEPEWASIRSTANDLAKSLDDHPENVKAMLGLAALFIQEGRITGNQMYYDVAAMKQVNRALEVEPKNFEALTFKALIHLSQHHFAEGLATATEAQKINPYNAFIYGLLVDANVEMGNYSAAVDNAEKMMSIRPDLRAYSRASYLREIHGDYPGAISAMKMAVDAGMPGDEATVWCRIQLGKLFENTGDLKSAEAHYKLALQERPSYSYAYAGLARVAAGMNDFKTAVSHAQKAIELSSDYVFREELADIYARQGNQQKAREIYQEVIEVMSTDADKSNNDENLGHYSDKELAYAYLKMNNVDKALNHALAEYNRRPENIDVNEAMAWVYYKKGEYQKALPHVQKALKTNSQNPGLLCRAGLIEAKAGQKEAAKKHLEQGLKFKTTMEQDLKNEAAAALQAL